MNSYLISPPEPHRIDRNLLGINKDSLTEGMFETFLEDLWIGRQPITFCVHHVEHDGHFSVVSYDMIAHKRPDLVGVYFRYMKELHLPLIEIDGIIQQYAECRCSESHDLD
ncbi:hypothetical protein [Herpetosiphon sp. NSE202]|uniref:hypothetical protein n=1 Tax=Herpetosiphon sp. NSE202 TaxID=3351349 RepID=UPI0036267847